MFKGVGHLDVQLKELEGSSHDDMAITAAPLLLEFVTVHTKK